MDRTQSTPYTEFLRGKSQLGNASGFEPVWMPDFLFPFQRHLVEWAIRQGRAALFADCGLGKTPMQLVWAENVVRKTNKPVLVITPLAVGAQTVREAEKFGIEAVQCRTGRDGRTGIIVTNYERLHYFDTSDFAGVVCDESSAIKSFDGVLRRVVTEFMRLTPYRLLCTATAAPNDYIEMGTSSEVLGQLGHMDMLSRFFKNDDNSIHFQFFRGGRWRFKKHAEQQFWRWVCSWARALRRPSDMGFADDGFVLPPLEFGETIVPCSRPREDMLFVLPAETLDEQREERLLTLDERCDAVARLVDHDRPAVVWCHLNREGDRLAEIIDGSVQVSGADSDEAKEEKFTAFSSGQVRALVTKPKIGAWGLNWQHCAHQTFFPSHSFEQFYQGTRRSWRFGQKRPVKIDVVTTEGERGVLDNLKRKAEAADRMFQMLVEHMNNAMRIERIGMGEFKPEIPKWL